MNRITRRRPIVGRYTFEEVALAARNSGMPLESLRHDVTPVGLHYCLIHFDIPDLAGPAWRLRIEGLVDRALTLSVTVRLALAGRIEGVRL
jgi:DMSO/TMAO reductase YedYZ molybdopterin-dependent catalytic subunit